jgi:hypothetical protein
MLSCHSCAVGLASGPQVQQRAAVDGRRPPQHQGAPRRAHPAADRPLTGPALDSKLVSDDVQTYKACNIVWTPCMTVLPRTPQAGEVAACQAVQLPMLLLCLMASCCRRRLRTWGRRGRRRARATTGPSSRSPAEAATAAARCVERISCARKGADEVYPITGPQMRALSAAAHHSAWPCQMSITACNNLSSERAGARAVGGGARPRAHAAPGRAGRRPRAAARPVRAAG